MPEMHLRKPGFTYSASGKFTKNREGIQKFKYERGSRFIYQNELDKASFQHYKDYEDFKDLTGRTDSNKVFRNKGFNIVKNSKYDGYQRGLASMVYKVFDKKSSGGTNENENMANKELAEEE